jgi:hypothetical protein
VAELRADSSYLTATDFVRVIVSVDEGVQWKSAPWLGTGWQVFVEQLGIIETLGSHMRLLSWVVANKPTMLTRMPCRDSTGHTQPERVLGHCFRAT